MNRYLEAAHSGALRLEQLVKGKGKFIYTHSARTGVPIKIAGDKYNLLRHAGSLWSMLVIENRTSAQTNLALNFLLEKGVSTNPGTLALAEKGRVKTGGNALLILALTEWHRLQPQSGSLRKAILYGEYLLTHQREDGDFIHKISLTGNEYAFRSNYYTGQIMFALMRLYECTGDEHYFAAVAKAEDFLSLQKYGVKEHSHWMLYALNRYHAALVSRGDTDAAAMVFIHVSQIMTGIITEFWPNFDPDRSNRIACRVEGLTQAVEVFKRYNMSWSGLESSVLAATQDMCNALLDLKLPNGDFVDERGKPTVHIDTIQHCSTALYRYGLILQEIENDNASSRIEGSPLPVSGNQEGDQLRSPQDTQDVEVRD